jgi:predicted ArsR family transcriptional regulator
MGYEDQAWERRKLVIESVTSGVPLKADDIQQRFKISRNAIFNDLRVLRLIGINVRIVDGYITNPDPDAGRIIREITFPPEYREAGVAILSYFARVLEQKCPEAGARVSIVQDGNTVRLQIETNKGDRQTIERTLSDYGKVVTGELLPMQFFSDPAAVTELSNKLEITKMELRLKEQNFLTYQSQSERRINELAGQVAGLMSLVGSQLSTVQTLSQALTSLASSERLSPAVAKALDAVTKLASSEKSEESEAKLHKALQVIRVENAGFFSRLKESASNIAHSVAGNLATPWVVAAINAFPK